MRSRVVSSLSSVLPTSQVLTSGYVNTETILHFFYNITNERGTKTVFTYAHVKFVFFYYSNHLSGWYCIDIERRNSVLVTHGSLRVNSNHLSACYLIDICKEEFCLGHSPWSDKQLTSPYIIHKKLCYPAHRLWEY